MKYKKTPRWPVIFLLGLVVCALFKDLIANDRPLFCKISGETFYPAFRCVFSGDGEIKWAKPLDSLDLHNAWKTYSKYESVVFCAIPFRAGKSEMMFSREKPLSRQVVENQTFTHYFGTNTEGQDVAAGVVSGCRTALFIGFGGASLALIIGLFFGGIAGFYGDNSLRISRASFWLNIVGFTLAGIYAFSTRDYWMQYPNFQMRWGIPFLIFIGIVNWHKLIKKVPLFAQKLTIPADTLIVRFIEFLESIPGMVLILALASFSASKRITSLTLILLVGFLFWTGIARFVRGELLKTREQSYILAAQSLGYSPWRVFLRHALPNAMRPVLVAFALSIGGVILLEASLSFLGFTDSNAGETWGGLLFGVRNNPTDWWIGLFPGLALTFTIMATREVLQ